MGNKSFDKVQFKTSLKEGSTRMKLKKDKINNQLHAERLKISQFVAKGEMDRALLLLSTYINDERKTVALDALRTICDQLQGRVTELESFGVTEDLAESVNSLIYSSKRIEIKELVEISEMLQIIMKPENFKIAIEGTEMNEIVRENIDIKVYENGQLYLKLNEICEKTNTKLHLKDEWKFTLREYCYRNRLDYPYKNEIEIDSHPVKSIEMPAELNNAFYAPSSTQENKIIKSDCASPLIFSKPIVDKNIEYKDYEYISSNKSASNFYPNSDMISRSELPPLPEEVNWPSYLPENSQKI